MSSRSYLDNYLFFRHCRLLRFNPEAGSVPNAPFQKREPRKFKISDSAAQLVAFAQRRFTEQDILRPAAFVLCNINQMGYEEGSHAEGFLHAAIRGYGKSGNPDRRKFTWIDPGVALDLVADPNVTFIEGRTYVAMPPVRFQGAQEILVIAFPEERSGGEILVDSVDMMKAHRHTVCMPDCLGHLDDNGILYPGTRWLCAALPEGNE